MVLLVRFTLVLLVLIASSAGVRAERLNVRGLKVNERIVMTYTSAGPGYLLRRIYSVDGGAVQKFTAIEQESVYDGKRRELSSDLEPIGTTDLTPEEAQGLDTYLAFLRQEYPGKCYAYDKIICDYFRDGEVIGSESFEDKTCVATWYTRKKGEVVLKGDSYMDFPPDLLRDMIPILLVEQRLWEDIKQAAKELDTAG
jgi:hypothetical protein